MADRRASGSRVVNVRGGSWSEAAELRGTPATDAEVLRASEHDPDRFGEIYRRHAGVIFGFAASRLGPQAADDVTAETFLAAFAIWHRFDPNRSGARPWLLGIAVRQIARRRREEAAHYRAVAAGGLGAREAAPEGETPAARAEAVALSGPLATALRSLRRGDRDVLLLVAWAELSYDEVAVALGIPIGTVRSRLHRARRTLRDLIPALGSLDEEAPSWTN